MYSAAKAAVVHLSKLGAMQLGADSIRVNAICPVHCDAVVTNTVGKPDSLLTNAWMNTQTVNPFREWVAREDIAHMALYLASDSPRS